MKAINKGKIKELLKYMSKQEYRSLVQDFMQETSTQLKSITYECWEHEPDEVIRLVHSIKGSAISLGFDQLSERSAIFEEELKSYKTLIKSSTFTSHNTYVSNFLITISNMINTMTDVDFKKVLVAEDSSVIQNLLKKILLFENCRITSAKDGQHVLDLFEKEDFDLIIMDINLPKIDGLEATKKIRANSDIPIIGISGNAKNLPEDEFYSAGMNEYMQKPLDYDILIDLVKKYTV